MPVDTQLILMQVFWSYTLNHHMKTTVWIKFLGLFIYPDIWLNSKW